MSTPAESQYESTIFPSLILTFNVRHYKTTDATEQIAHRLGLTPCLSQSTISLRCLSHPTWTIMPVKTSNLRGGPLVLHLSQGIWHNICRHGTSDGQTRRLALEIEEKGHKL